MFTVSSDNEPDIVIHRLIIHKVDHKKYDLPILADLETEITDEVASFVRQHIRRNRNHKNTSTAQFDTDPENIEFCVRQLTEAILQDETLFVVNTKRIAELLFTAQKKKSSSPGELVVCLFGEDTNKESRWLGLMKMDPEDGFVGREETINGQIRVVLEKVEGVFPTGDLQKCAFVLPLSHKDRKQFDLVVLDQQPQYYGGARQIASFFLHDFLNCVRDLNRRDLTTGFLKHVNRWADEKIDSWSFEAIDQLKDAALNAVQGQVIDVPAFAQQQLNDSEEEARFIETFKSALIDIGNVSDLVFSPDADIKKKMTRYRTFKGDHGLQIRVNKGENVPPDIIDVERAESAHLYIITIKTSTWQEI